MQIGYRLHRKLLLDAIASLKEQQPDGTAEPGNLWEYIHDDPTTAALYVSGVLCTPRLTMLWLYTFEYNSTLGPLLADEDESSDQVAYHAPRSIQEFLVLFPIRANKILFWIGWLCCPALMVRILHPHTPKANPQHSRESLAGSTACCTFSEIPYEGLLAAF